jgi:hypothetical protein
MQCQQATYSIEQHVLKRKLPFFHYNVTERQRLLKEPSKAIWLQPRKTKLQKKVKEQTLDKQTHTPPLVIKPQTVQKDYDINIK